MLSPRQAVVRQVSSGGKITVPQKEIDAKVKTLLEIRPLVRTTEDEKLIIASATNAAFVSYWDKMGGLANRIIDGDTALTGKPDLDIGQRRELVASAFSDWEGSKTKFECKCDKNQCSKRITFEKYRTLSDYNGKEGVDIAGAVAISCKNDGFPARILEVGAGDSNTLHELKGQFGDRIETHALGLFEEPHAPVDAHHSLSAEFYPAEFSKKFDMIFSFYTMGYLALPHLGLRNIAHSLSDGGKAIVHFALGDLKSGNDEKGLAGMLESHLKEYLGMITDGKSVIANYYGELVTGFMRLENLSPGTLFEKASNVYRAAAWACELGLIGASTRFKLEINRIQKDKFGDYPDIVTIERRKES